MAGLSLLNNGTLKLPIHFTSLRLKWDQSRGSQPQSEALAAAAKAILTQSMTNVENILSLVQCYTHPADVFSLTQSWAVLSINFFWNTMGIKKQMSNTSPWKHNLKTSLLYFLWFLTALIPNSVPGHVSESFDIIRSTVKKTSVKFT